MGSNNEKEGFYCDKVDGVATLTLRTAQETIDREWINANSNRSSCYKLLNVSQQHIDPYDYIFKPLLLFSYTLSFISHYQIISLIAKALVDILNSVDEFTYLGRSKRDLVSTVITYQAKAT